MQQEQGLNTSVFDEIIETGRIQARVRLAGQLAQLAADREASDYEKRSIIPTLLKLASDPVKQVRIELAEKLAQCEDLHPDVVFSIVADDSDIALPFLAETPSLDNYRMMAILKVGDQARQLIIAARANLADEAIAYICDKTEVEVCAALLDNEAIHIKAQYYRRLYTRFREVPEIVERLLARSDLPLEVRIMQAKRASGKVHSLMLERGWVAANDAEEIVVDAEETTLLKIMSSASDTELERLVPFVCNKGMMTPSVILRSACLGEMQVMAGALAYLSNQTKTRVLEIIKAGNAASLKGIYTRAGLPLSCFNIVLAACDASRQLSEMPAHLAKHRHGGLLIEYLLTRYQLDNGQDRSNLLEIVSRLGDDHARDLAKRLAAQMKFAA